MSEERQVPGPQPRLFSKTADSLALLGRQVVMVGNKKDQLVGIYFTRLSELPQSLNPQKDQKFSWVQALFRT